MQKTSPEEMFYRRLFLCLLQQLLYVADHCCIQKGSEIITANAVAQVAQPKWSHGVFA